MPEIFIDMIKTQLDNTKIPNDNFLIADIIGVREPINERAPYNVTLKDAKGDEITAAVFAYSKYADTEEKAQVLKDKVLKFVAQNGKKVKITKIGKKTSFQNNPQLQISTVFEYEIIGKQLEQFIPPAPVPTPAEIPKPIPKLAPPKLMERIFNKMFDIQGQFKKYEESLKDVQMSFEQLYELLRELRGDK